MSITLQAQDGTPFQVTRQIAERSMLLKNMLEDLGDSSDTPVPLPNVTSNILEKVLEYCTHHKNDPIPQQSDDASKDDFESGRRTTDDIDEWDAAFIKVDNETLFEIILAANYMDIKGLLDLGCKTVALMMKGKSPEEIRTMFNIENDFTPDEEEQIRRENEWAADI